MEIQSYYNLLHGLLIYNEVFFVAFQLGNVDFGTIYINIKFASCVCGHRQDHCTTCTFNFKRQLLDKCYMMISCLIKISVELIGQSAWFSRKIFVNNNNNNNFIFHWYALTCALILVMATKFQVLYSLFSGVCYSQ